MSIQISFKNQKPDDSEKKYLESRITKLVELVQKIAPDYDLKVFFDGKATGSQKKGEDLFFVEATLALPKAEPFFAAANGPGFKVAFDKTKDKLRKEILNYQKRKNRELRLGQQSLKKIIRGYLDN